MIYCPACAEEVINPAGSTDCDFIIVEEFPELCLPTPAMGYNNAWKREEWTPKKILANELTKIGMVPQQFRIVSVFPHLPPANGMPDENCYNAGLSQAVNEINGKRGVIVLGSNLCKEFTCYDLKKVQGLSGVESQYIPDGDVPRVFLSSVRTIYSVGAGKFRLGLQRFANQLQENE